MENRALSELLEPGETVVWSGTPNRDQLLVRSDYWWIPLGLLIALLALAAFIASIVAFFGGSAGGVVGMVVAIALGAIAYQLVIGRVVRRRASLAGLNYAITDRRVMVVGSGGQQVAALNGAKPELTQHYNNRGTIELGGLRLENINEAPVVFEIISGQVAAAGH